MLKEVDASRYASEHSLSLAIYLPRMSNSMFTFVPTVMSRKLVCSKV